MIWNSSSKTTLLLNCKDLAIHLGEVISRRLDLGQPIDGFLDDWYLMCNVTFSLEEYSTITGTYALTNDELDYFYSLYTRTQIKHNRYKGFGHTFNTF